MTRSTRPTRRPVNKHRRGIEGATGDLLERRKLNLKANFQSSSSQLSFKALSFWRFQCGFDRFNLHRLALLGHHRNRAICPPLIVLAKPQACVVLCAVALCAWYQGLTLVPISAQLEHFLPPYNPT